MSDKLKRDFPATTATVQLPNNLTIIDPRSSISDAVSQLNQMANGAHIHLTNGTYAAQDKPIIDTLTKGFHYVCSEANDKADEGILVIAMNSDTSLRAYFSDNIPTPPSEMERACFCGIPLANQNPGKKVIVVFYDDKTPVPLYEEMARQDLNIASLHKIGNYGTLADGPELPGYDTFMNYKGCKIYAFPLPNKEKALCEDKTAPQSAVPEGLTIVRNLFDPPQNTPHPQPTIG